MKIYTKRGDSGETGLYGGARIPKNALRIQAYGTIDELNAVLGLVLAEDGVPADVSPRLERIQGELFQLGAELATPRDKKLASKLVDQASIELQEREIDAMEEALSPLKAFILPGGGRVGANLHLARTVSRRAEREIVTLHQLEPVRPEVLQYVNRLSDYLFVCARYANHREGKPDVPWVAPKP
jgi:cob(I)alamin adenosyltransferase